MTESPEAFDLEVDDWYMVQMARQTARGILQRHDASPEVVIALGRVLFALDRLPLSTKGISCSFGAVFDGNPSDIHGSLFYITFHVSTDRLAIESGGYQRSPGGGDSFSYPGYSVEVGGHFLRECDPREAKQTIQEYLDDGGRIEIEDYSDLEVTGFQEQR